MESTAFNRVMLRDDWLLHREERARIQWYDKTETLRKLLESASQRFKSEKAQELLQEAILNFNVTHSLFATVLEKHQRKEHAAKQELIFNEAESRMISQVFLKAYSLNDNIDGLREFFLREATTTRNILFILIILLVPGCIMVIGINSVFLNKIVEQEINALTSGIKVIGDGNLDYQISVTGDNELADLAKAMNEMSDKMKQSYISVENLQQEIDQRQLVQEKLNRANRVLSVINHINQAIIRSTEQNELFTEACLIAVENGKFTMAWIGLIDEQENTVIPLCWKGVEEGYLAKIKKISTYDTPEGNGPTGRAIREGKVYYCNDIANDPIMAPWREEALKRGYGSSVALPLICQSRVIGAFSIYAAEPFFFNEAEVTLLDEVTSDINYAIEKMASEKKRRQMEDEIKSINEELELRVANRTAELSAKTAELERINKVFVNRELRMRELKARIVELEKQKT
jgi:nitrate/nitrite-specific signal transduction histidine kinase